MALPPGTRLGAYEVTASLGAGGMGEVYRARDTKLDRDVAIKILPESFASDADRVMRFEREAKTLASLNHPHIAQIYGFEQSGATSALVMELVDGEDLSQRIARGPIPIDEALPIAKQIAEALEAAHEQGIIHRDLKPANVKVRPDGTVKVLDFGLAKAMDQGSGIGDRGSGGVANSPTITSPAMTMRGVILGTAAYMSPEQAKGKFVDKRADIWAFGVVLYEMLTGRRLFDAEDTSETLAAVLTRDVSMTTMPVAIPPRLRALLRECLIRDPKHRLRDIGDARNVIEKIIAGAADDPTTATAPITSPSWRALPWAVAAAALAAAAIALWAPWRAASLTDRPLVRLDVELGSDVVLPSANATWGTIAISPDGSRLAYVSGSAATPGMPRKLFTRRLDQPRATELAASTSMQGDLFFSTDGQWIGFRAGGKLNKVSVDGGAVVPIGDVADGFGGGSWDADGSIIGSEAFGKGLIRYPATGGSPTVLTARASNEFLVVPQHLPGGTAILFAACTENGADGCNVEVLTPADGRRKVVARGGHSPHYLPSTSGRGHLLYLNKATLFAAPFDLATGELRGSAVPVLDDVGFHPTTGAGLFHVSPSGTLIYRKSRLEAAATSTIQWVDAAGKREAVRAKPAAYVDLCVSPDGKRMLVSIADGVNQDLWVYDPQRDAMTRLTFGGVNRFPVWSPDGRYAVYMNAIVGISQVRTDGSIPPQPLTGAKARQVPWSFTPDGKRLAYYETQRNQIWTVPLEEQASQLKAGTPEPFLKSTFADVAPAFSPDGRWLAYQSNESGRGEVYVRAFPPPSAGQGGKWQISNNGGIGPRWSLTGRDLLYRSGDQLLAVGYSVNGDAFVAEKPRVLFPALGGISAELSADGKRVAVLIPEGSTALQPEHQIVMLQNFTDELRRRVPLGK